MQKNLGPLNKLFSGIAGRKLRGNSRLLQAEELKAVGIAAGERLTQLVDDFATAEADAVSRTALNEAAAKVQHARVSHEAGELSNADLALVMSKASSTNDSRAKMMAKSE